VSFNAHAALVIKLVLLGFRFFAAAFSAAGLLAADPSTFVADLE
jgi:hypothetical protein